MNARELNLRAHRLESPDFFLEKSRSRARWVTIGSFRVYSSAMALRQALPFSFWTAGATSRFRFLAQRGGIRSGVDAHCESVRRRLQRPVHSIRSLDRDSAGRDFFHDA